MASTAYFCLNGEFIKENEPRLYTDNSAFRYGEALTENIHAYATGLQFLSLHLQRLKSCMKFLEIETPAFLNEVNIRQLSVSLLNRNKIFGGAAIRLTVFKNKEEDTKEHSISFVLEARSLESGKYTLNDKGLAVGLCEKYKKTTGEFAHIHRAGALLYHMAAVECRHRNLDAVILMNEKGRMIETADSNLFLVKGDSLFTPGLHQGCIPGVMREVVIRIATEAGLRINDLSNLTPAAMSDADEVFITNAIRGIRWIGAWEQIRYFNKTSRLLCARLNDYAFPSDI